MNIAKKIKNKNGFTLIELVIVIAIVAVLAAVGIPAVAGQVKKSQDATAQENANLIASTAQKMITDMESGGSSIADINTAVTGATAMAKAGIAKGTVTVFTLTDVPDPAGGTDPMGRQVDKVVYQAANGNTKGTFERV